VNKQPDTYLKTTDLIAFRENDERAWKKILSYIRDLVRNEAAHKRFSEVELEDLFCEVSNEIILYILSNPGPEPQRIAKQIRCSASRLARRIYRYNRRADVLNEAKSEDKWRARAGEFDFISHVQPLPDDEFFSKEISKQLTNLLLRALYALKGSRYYELLLEKFFLRCAPILENERVSVRKAVRALHGELVKALNKTIPTINNKEDRAFFEALSNLLANSKQADSQAVARLLESVRDTVDVAEELDLINRTERLPCRNSQPEPRTSTAIDEVAGHARRSIWKHVKRHQREKARTVGLDVASDWLPSMDCTRADTEDYERDPLLDPFIDQAMGKMPPASRNLLEWKYVEEKTYAEISKLLECSEAYAKVKVFRAKRLCQNLVIKELKRYLLTLPLDHPKRHIIEQRTALLARTLRK